jgi:hypothetical protein
MTVTAFEVGALFRVVDDATVPLRKILASVRELSAAIKTAREGMAGLGGAVASGIAGAVADVNLLTAAWGRVEAATIAAAKAARGAAPAASAAAGASTAAAARGLGGGSGRLHTGGNAARATGLLPNITVPGVPLPGGSRMNLTGTPALAAAAGLAYGITEASSMQYDAMVLNYHLGRADTPENNDQIRQIIEEGMKSTGEGLPAVAKSATVVAQQMRDVPGFDVLTELPKFLRAAKAESIAKGTPLQESMNAIVGMSHMVKAWTPDTMEKLFHVFAYLSTANPMPLAQEEKAFSYAVPILQSGADIDPVTTMILGTALATSGVNSTKAGTWTREMVVRSLPGNAAHNALLKQLHLLDEDGKPTWFTNGKPDPVKALEIAGPIAAAMPPEQRLPAEMDVFGRRGAGAFSVLANPQILERLRQLRAGIEDPGNRNRYETLVENSRNATTKGIARGTLQEFNVAMIELGTIALPPATAGIKGLSAALGIFGGGHQTKEDKSFSPNWMERLHDYTSPGNWLKGGWFGNGVSGLPKQQDGLLKPHAAPAPIVKIPMSLTLNVDGKTLAQAVAGSLGDLSTFSTGAPAGDAMDSYAGGEHHQMDH